MIIIGNKNSRYPIATVVIGRLCSLNSALLFLLCSMPHALCPAPSAISRMSCAEHCAPGISGLINLLDYSGGDQGQQNFMVADEIDALAAFGGGSVDDIGQGAIVFDEIQVDGGKIFQGIS